MNKMIIIDTAKIGVPVDSTYPITNDGTLTNVWCQRKSNHVILRPHDLRIQLDLRTYHKNCCFCGYEK